MSKQICVSGRPQTTVSICSGCTGYRYDEMMDDTYYCSKYLGVWDEYKLTRKCVYSKPGGISPSHLVRDASASSDQKYFINRIVNGKASPHEVETKCYPFTMDDVKFFAHRSIDNPKCWIVTEFSTGFLVSTLYHSTKKAAIIEVEDIIHQKPGWLQKCMSNAPKLFKTAQVEINDCNNCGHINCKLLENGMADLCKGKGFVQKGIVTPSPSLSPSPASVLVNTHDQRTTQAAKEFRAALDEWNEKYGKNSHNFVWEAEMDCLMAPPAPEQPQEQIPAREENPGRLVDVYDYIPVGDKMKRKIMGHAELISLERQEFPTKTIFPAEFPTPVVCQEFCDKTAHCHLREEGIGDLCKNSSKFGKLVHPVNLKWSAWHDFRNRLPKTQFVHSTRTGTAPEIALAHWGSPDAPMTTNRDNNGDDEYVSPQEQAREFGDRDAVRFIPAYIFGPGKPEWRAVVKEDKAGFPYTKLVKYPSIRPIACRVELRNGYVVPLGKAASSLKITSRADKKRARAYSAIRKELALYVGAERAGKMAGQQVAAMATC